MDTVTNKSLQLIEQFDLNQSFATYSDIHVVSPMKLIQPFTISVEQMQKHRHAATTCTVLTRSVLQ